MDDDEIYKLAITRYIKLNQPTKLNQLLREIENQDPIYLFSSLDAMNYMRRAYKLNKIRTIPDIFDKTWWSSVEKTRGRRLKLQDFLTDEFDIEVIIPDYISYVWKRWIIKKIIE